jgi:hypothetical protein
MHRLFFMTFMACAVAAATSFAAESLVAEEDRMIMTCQVLQTAEQARGGSTNPTYYWDQGIVPYAFDSSISTTNRNRMASAMGIVESHCSVLFVERTNEPDWLQITEQGGNWSYVGQIFSGAQELSIYNWSYPYIIAHELSHALGRHHQMSRSDRNSYLTVNLNCIVDDCESNYQIASTVNYEPYDFMSVMHYGQWDCSTGCPTMTCLPGYTQYQNAMGQSSYFTASDSSVLSQMYPGGDPDVTVAFVNLTPDECDAGDTINVFGVIRNDGDWFNRGVTARIYLSDDTVIDSNDQFLGSEYFEYIMSGGFGYLNKDVTIPASWSDGTWYIGVSLLSSDDVNNGNNTGSSQLIIGDAETPCEGDTDGDGNVNVNDLLAVISSWGPCSGCAADIDDSGAVDVNDLLSVISAWGACP